MNLIELCAGYGSQALAFKKAGMPYDIVAWSEFDPESKKPLDNQPAVIAHNLLHPEAKGRNLGDMTKIDWEAWRRLHPDIEIDLLTYSTPCFVAGTLVLTDKGFVAIEYIKVGDKVLTHGNDYKKVIDIGHKPSDEIIRISAMMTDEILCTPNHPFYTRKRYRSGSIRMFASPEWKKAGQLDKDDYLGFAINCDSRLPEWDGVELHNWGHNKKVNVIGEMLDKKELWYLMGRYVGDGWTRNDYTHKAVIIACSERNKASLIDALDRLRLHYTLTHEKTCSKVTIYNSELMEFVGRYGKGASTKSIDGETLALPTALLDGFLKGYIDSDGCFDGSEYKITTTSRLLAYGLCQVIAKCRRRPSRMYYCERPEKHIIEDRVINQMSTYSVSWHDDDRTQDKAFYEDGYVWFPIRYIEKTNKERVRVYNLEVEEDHSYTANGCIVHNCQSISQAGLQHGLAEGSGTRSSILWYTEEAVRVLRPKYLLQENVKALVSKKFMPDFLKWCKKLEDLGYTNYWQVMNAADYGIPQHRERVFMISIRNDIERDTFKFPTPWKLDTVLADVLEEDADPNFFLRDEMVQKFLKNNEKEWEDVIYVVTDKFLAKEEVDEILKENEKDCQTSQPDA